MAPLLATDTADSGPLPLQVVVSATDYHGTALATPKTPIPTQPNGHYTTLRAYYQTE